METMDRYYLVEFGENQVQKFPAHEVEDAFKFALRKRHAGIKAICSYVVRIALAGRDEENLGY